MSGERPRLRARATPTNSPTLPCTAAPRLSRRRYRRQSNERHEARATPWPMTTNRSERDVATASAAKRELDSALDPCRVTRQNTSHRRPTKRAKASDERRAPARVERTPARAEQSTSDNGQKWKAPPQQAQRERERPPPTNSHARCVTGRGCHSPIQHNRKLRSGRRRPRRQTPPSSQ